ncbi:hypothetical protein [Micromonospora sp. NPDC003816]|uniref:hypothetical protein n=2 Tax=unclassified Micromonospora TaxID=2617518 RepID=UPI0026A65452
MATSDGTVRKRDPERPVSLRTPDQPSMLPDWMRDPPPPRRTLGARVGDRLAALPGARWLRGRWWAWQRRQRLYQRFPVTTKIVMMVVAWTLALILVLAAYGIFSLI